MPSFRYKAMTASGTLLTGEMEAASPAGVAAQLRSLGHYPIAAEDGGRGDWWASLARELLRPRRAAQRDLAVATQELATLLHAGLPLDRALEMLVGLGETQRLRRPLEAVLERVRGGAALADALAADRAFPRLYVSMVRAGEMGANLEGTLQRLADYLAKAQITREAITSALVYPTILLVTAGLSISVILIFVLPEFEPLFREAGKSLPLATRIVMAAGDILGRFWWLLLLLIAAAIGAALRALRQPALRRRWDALLLRLPLLGALVTKVEMERFSRTLGTLIGNGVPLPTALGITRDTLANSVIAEAAGATAASLREGDGLAERLARTKVFPAITLDLIRIGEETGKLEEMLLRQADISERSVKHTVDRLLALLVPGLTVFLGFVVAGLIASMLMAILSINELAAR